MLEPSGEFGADLRQFVHGVCEFWRDPIVASATMGILADRHRDPALFIRTQKLLDEQTQHKFAELVGAGIEQGMVRPDVDIQMLYELLIGTSFYTVQVQHCDDVDDVVERLCALVMQGAGVRGEEKS
jgi:hypothetical protein